jgi:hypothetical protein
MMDHMKDLGLPGLAEKYKDLSDKVMEHELNRYVPIFRALPPATSTPMPMPMPMPTPSALEFSDTSAMDVDSQDEDFWELSGTGGPADSILDEDGYGSLQFQ